MSQEIYYTSAPQGLKPGSRGFCTVVSTQGMARNLAEQLEALSGYRHVFSPQEAEAALNPVVYSHLKLSIAGRPWHVLSRVCDAGLDYTQRTNKFAHHVVLDATERVAGGPAWLLSAAGFMETAWDGRVRILPAGRKPPAGEARVGVCRAWAELTGDAGYGGVLAATALPDVNRQAVVVFRPGMDMLPLVAESLALLAAPLRWEVTFCTYYTRLPAGLECRWRFVVEGSPEAGAARATPQTVLINLCRPLPAAPGGPLVEAARSGVVPSLPVAGERSAAATAETAGMLELADEEPAGWHGEATSAALRAGPPPRGPAPLAETFGLGPPPRTGGREQPLPVVRPAGRTRRKSGRRKWVLAAVLLPLAAAMGVGGWWGYQSLVASRTTVAKTAPTSSTNGSTSPPEAPVTAPPVVPGKDPSDQQQADRKPDNGGAETGEAGVGGASAASSRAESSEEKSPDAESTASVKRGSGAGSNPQENSAKNGTSASGGTETQADENHPPPVPKVPEWVALPEIPSAGQSREPKPLFAIGELPDDFKIKWPNGLMGDTALLDVSHEVKGTKWQIRRKPMPGTPIGPGGGGGNPLGTLNHRDGKVYFEWAGAAQRKDQDDLRQCCLIVLLGKKEHPIALWEPKTDSPPYRIVSSNTIGSVRIDSPIQPAYLRFSSAMISSSENVTCIVTKHSSKPEVILELKPPQPDGVEAAGRVVLWCHVKDSGQDTQLEVELACAFSTWLLEAAERPPRIGFVEAGHSGDAGAKCYRYNTHVLGEVQKKLHTEAGDLTGTIQTLEDDLRQGALSEAEMDQKKSELKGARQRQTERSVQRDAVAEFKKYVEEVIGKSRLTYEIVVPIDGRELLVVASSEAD